MGHSSTKQPEIARKFSEHSSPVAERDTLAQCVVYLRPIGCPEMSFVRTVENALKRNDHPRTSRVVRALWGRLLYDLATGVKRCDG